MPCNISTSTGTKALQPCTHQSCHCGIHTCCDRIAFGFVCFGERGMDTWKKYMYYQWKLGNNGRYIVCILYTIIIDNPNKVSKLSIRIICSVNFRICFNADSLHSVSLSNEKLSLWRSNNWKSLFIF